VTPSDEVNDATGEAPARATDKTIEVLNDKKTELASAQERYADAKAKRDHLRMADEQRLIEVLQVLIADLEGEAVGVLESDASRRAKTWVRKQAKELTTVADRITAQQEVIRQKVEDLVAAIDVEANLRGSVGKFDISDRILAARFGFPRTKAIASLPELRDWTMPVLLATDAMRPSGRERQLVFAYIASDTPEVRRRREITAAVEFVRNYGKELPDEVRSIVSETPAPKESPAPVKDDGDAFIGAQVARALSGFPGQFGIGGI
jgi:hypothetical protein